MNKQEPQRNLFQLFEPLIIFVFWFLLFASPLILGNYEYGIDWPHIFRVWINYIPYLVVFLINRFIFLPYLFFTNKRVLFFLSVTLLIVVMAMGIYPSQERMLLPPNRQALNERIDSPPGTGLQPPDRRNQNPLAKPPPNRLPPYISFAVISLLIVGFDTGLKVSVEWVRSEQKRTYAEKENMETQLAFLKNQISPHFFMNTLNNIHSLIDFDTDEAKESVISLSRLMRHLLYDSEVDKIPIQKEVDFISNYVDLMKLRYSDKVKITLNLPARIPEKSIPPLLFTSFVENAFKHGISYEKSSFIDITFSFERENLYFQIVNSQSGSEKENGHNGIGIVNSQKRLKLLYGNRYNLKIENLSDIFTVNLTIPL